MQRTNFGEMSCSIARTLDVIGEPWSPLILRDVWAGVSRFDQLQADLGISRKVLTERLDWLLERGILERRPYDNRPRYEYVLTEQGAELVDMLMVMVRWGDKWLAGEKGPPVLYRHHACGHISAVDLRCAQCGEPMHARDVDLLPGPGSAPAATLSATGILNSAGVPAVRGLRRRSARPARRFSPASPVAVAARRGPWHTRSRCTA